MSGTKNSPVSRAAPAVMPMNEQPRSIKRPAHATISDLPAKPKPAAPAAQPAAAPPQPQPQPQPTPTAQPPAGQRVRRTSGETRITRSFPKVSAPPAPPQPTQTSAPQPEPPAPAGKPASAQPHPRPKAAKPAARPAKPAAAPAKRHGKGKGGAPAAPLTPQEVIRRKRRRCADAEDIVSFFTKLAAIVIMLALLLGYAFGVTPMHNDDMAPRISAGDLLLYYRLADDWVNGDVMVFEKDGQQYVGRIVARAGDTVEVTDQATLIVNGSTVLENNIFYTTPKYDNGPTYPLTLAEGEFFVLCDYREGARDSRYFGPVRESEIKGKVITVARRSNL